VLALRARTAAAAERWWAAGAPPGHLPGAWLRGPAPGWHPAPRTPRPGADSSASDIWGRRLCLSGSHGTGHRAEIRRKMSIDADGFRQRSLAPGIQPSAGGGGHR